MPMDVDESELGRIFEAIADADRRGPMKFEIELKPSAYTMTEMEYVVDRIVVDNIASPLSEYIRTAFRRYGVDPDVTDELISTIYYGELNERMKSTIIESFLGGFYQPPIWVYPSAAISSYVRDDLVLVGLTEPFYVPIRRRRVYHVMTITAMLMRTLGMNRTTADVQRALLTYAHYVPRGPAMNVEYEPPFFRRVGIGRYVPISDRIPITLGGPPQRTTFEVFMSELDIESIVTPIPPAEGVPIIGVLSWKTRSRGTGEYIYSYELHVHMGTMDPSDRLKIETALQLYMDRALARCWRGRPAIRGGLEIGVPTLDTVLRTFHDAEMSTYVAAEAVPYVGRTVVDEIVSFHLTEPGDWVYIYIPPYDEPSVVRTGSVGDLSRRIDELVKMRREREKEEK